ncbi:MAG: thiamine phosphate synthase [Prevotellaceae bacterium]|nr:thiamine phosphate synthase [Prevotellaceae bacterium]
MLGAAWERAKNISPLQNFSFQFITHTNEKYNYLQSAELALAGGCRWVQLRMKDAPLHEVEKTALKLREMCREAGATFIIDDHVALAKKVGADGVHIGKTDMPPEEARAILGKDFIIGGTANTFEDIKRLAAAGVDYVGLGPFRFTQTKKNLSSVLGLEGYEKIIKQCRAANINLPVVAIGGITTADIRAIMNTGVCGIAVSGSILGAREPVEETKEIIRILDLQIK